MCLFRSKRSCSPSSRSSVLDSSSLVFLALSILSKTSRLSLYCFLFPSKRNSGSGLLSLPCFWIFSSSSSFFSFFNFFEYRFCCCNSSVAQLGGSSVRFGGSSRSGLLCFDPWLDQLWPRWLGLLLYGSSRLTARELLFKHLVSFDMLYQRFVTNYRNKCKYLHTLSQKKGQAMAVNKKQLPAFTHHMTLTHLQAPAVCEKNIFHLFHSTRPVENHPY